MMDIQSALTGNRGVALPFTDYCEPIMSEDAQLQDIFLQLVNYGKKANWRFIELRDGANFFQDATPYATYFGHSLVLSLDEEYCFFHFKGSTRRNIRKALAEGVEIKILNSMESIREFYKLNCLTRKRHGLPSQPYHLFKSIYDNIISEDRGLVVMAYYKNIAIAGAVYFHLGDKAIYKYGASDRRYQHLRANNLVMWEAIKWYCRNGYQSFYFGRTEMEHVGLRQFKIGWGAEEYPILYYRYSLRKSIFLTEKRSNLTMFHDLFSRLPVPLLKMIGRILYRHMG